MRYIIILLFLITFAFAEKPAEVAKPKTPGLGVVTGNAQGIIVGDYNLFPQDKLIYGVKRYGGGFSYFRIGEGRSISMSSNTGFFLYDPVYPINFVVALEPTNGNLHWDSNEKSESFYEWLPMAATGIQALYGEDYRMVLVYRYGYSFGNLKHNGISPKGHLAKGYSFYFNNDNKGIGYNYVKIDKDKVIENFEIHFRNIGAKYGRVIGEREEKSIIILIRFIDF